MKGLGEAVRMSLSDVLGTGARTIKNNKLHLKAAMDWIATAQDATPDGGVSKGYSVPKGEWEASYPETTGYIIPTMFDYSLATRNYEYKQRALRMADWQISVQMENGAFQSGNLDTFPKKPAVFNTGQVLFGLVEAYKETKEEKYKKAAEKAASWLLNIQDNDGAWRRELSSLTSSPEHTYNARTALGLLKVHSITQKRGYVEAASKNVDWSLTQQLANGWFRNTAFNANEEPLLHTIAYTVEGILECGVYLRERSYINAAKKSADALLKRQRKDGSLAGKYDSKWRNTVNWSCLAGDAQISLIWLRLFELSGDEKYLNAARKLNHFLRTTQNLRSTNEGIRGGIKGSHPAWGGYLPFSYLSWAAKFFVDDLLLEERILMSSEKAKNFQTHNPGEGQTEAHIKTVPSYMSSVTSC